MEGTENPIQVDIKKVLHDKNPKLARAVPGFVIRYLKRIVHQDEINALLRDFSHLKGLDFNREALKKMGISHTAHGTERIPRGGRNIFVSNHPLGGLDGMVFINELSDYFPDIKFPVNDILMNIPNYSGIFLPVNKHGSLGREAARLMEEAFMSDSQILTFPAGICSRKINGVITDLEWQKSFIVKAVQYKRDVVPCYFRGRNSSFFYNLSLIRGWLGIKANLEMLYLADEMFRQKGKKIDLYFGEPIPWQTFTGERSPKEWADYVREKTYNLPSSVQEG